MMTEKPKQTEWGPEETKKFLWETFMKMKPAMLDILKMDMPIGLDIALVVDEKNNWYLPVLTETYQNVIYMVELGLLNILEESKEGLIWKFTLGPGTIHNAMIKYLKGEL